MTYTTYIHILTVYIYIHMYIYIHINTDNTHQYRYRSSYAFAKVKLHFQDRRHCDVHDPMFLRCLLLGRDNIAMAVSYFGDLELPDLVVWVTI